MRNAVEINLVFFNLEFELNTLTLISLQYFETGSLNNIHPFKNKSFNPNAVALTICPFNFSSLELSSGFTTWLVSS